MTTGTRDIHLGTAVAGQYLLTADGRKILLFQEAVIVSDCDIVNLLEVENTVNLLEAENTVNLIEIENTVNLLEVDDTVNLLEVDNTANLLGC